LFCAFFAHQVHLVLENDDVVELHDFDRCEMLGSLGLRACFVTCDQKERGIHNRCTGQHGAHQNVVARAVHKTVFGQFVDLPRGLDIAAPCRHLRDVSEQSISPITTLSLTRRIDLLLTLETPVARWAGTVLAFALVDLRIRIP